VRGIGTKAALKVGEGGIMGTKIFVTLLTLLGSFSLSVPSIAESPAIQQTSGAWTKSGRNLNSNRSGAKEVVYGNVLSTEDLKPGPGNELGVQMTVNTEEGDLRILLGPRWYLPEHDLNLSHGEPVTIVGIRITWDGKPAIVADEIRQGSKKLVLHAPSNEPKDVPSNP
jgi:hypothetical protein